MAAASLVATAFGIIIIIVTAYVLAGGTLLTSEVVMNAQKDMTELQEKMLGTSMRVISNRTDGSYFYIQVLNDGREPIRDFEHIDVYLAHSTDGWSRYTYVSSGTPSSGEWTKESDFIRIIEGEFVKESIYPKQWDPGEITNMTIGYPGIPEGYKIVTANGVSNF